MKNQNKPRKNSNYSFTKIKSTLNTINIFISIQLDCKSYVKYLGLRSYKSLTFEIHINHIIGKSHMQLYKLFPIFNNNQK